MCYSKLGIHFNKSIHRDKLHVIGDLSAVVQRTESFGINCTIHPTAPNDNTWLEKTGKSL